MGKLSELYTHLCKQFYHIKITLKVFPNSYPVIKFDIGFALKRWFTEFHVRNASSKIWHSVNRKGLDTFQTRLLVSQKVIKLMKTLLPNITKLHEVIMTTMTWVQPLFIQIKTKLGIVSNIYIIYPSELVWRLFLTFYKKSTEVKCWNWTTPALLSLISSTRFCIHFQSKTARWILAKLGSLVRL